jgi:hypothetical protein
MRRSLFFLVAIIVLPTPALSAQSLWLGAKAGRSSAKLTVDEDDLGSRRVGFTGGVTLTIEFTQAFALQGEVLYAEKGFGERPGDWEMQITYLETPVLLRLAIPTGTLVRPVILAGVAWSLEVDCGGWTTLPRIPEAPPPDPIPLDCDHMRTDHQDMGLVVAGGLDFRVGRFSVIVEGRYSGGMTDIASGYEFATVKNETVAFLVGVGLPIWRP